MNSSKDFKICGFTSRRYHCNWYTAGVGAGLQPPQFLQPGDEVKVTIDNIGTLTTYISKIKSYTIFKS